MIDRNGKCKVKQKLWTLASRDNGIKTDVVVVVELLKHCKACIFYFEWSLEFGHPMSKLT